MLCYSPLLLGLLNRDVRNGAQWIHRRLLSQIPTHQPYGLTLLPSIQSTAFWRQILHTYTCLYRLSRSYLLLPRVSLQGNTSYRSCRSLIVPLKLGHALRILSWIQESFCCLQRRTTCSIYVEHHTASSLRQ